MMKHTKKLLAWLLIAGLPATAAAEAVTLDRAAAPVEAADFARYPSCTLGDDGRWSVRSNPADALLDRFWDYAAANSASVCAFSLELEGDARTGVWSPVLQFHYSGSRSLNATAVSILADGVRYDLAATSSATTRDGDTAELISAPLTADALTAVKAMMAAEEVSVRLIGEKTYTFELDRDATGTRARIEAASLIALDSGLELLEEAGLSDYALWDLSAAAWESLYGFEPAFQQSEVVAEVGGETVSDEFGMVEYGDQTKAAKAAQQLLIDHGFLSGSTSGTFGENSVAAARRAQHWLGMIETGCVDAQLEKALSESAAAEAETESEGMTLGGAAQIALNRWWTADGVSAVNAPDSLQSVYNADNALVIADGEIRNLSADELKLFTQLTATLTYSGGASYEATVLCERDEGSALDMTMLPMAQARLVVYAEVPGWLAAQEDAAWSLTLSLGGEEIEFELQ